MMLPNAPAGLPRPANATDGCPSVTPASTATPPITQAFKFRMARVGIAIHGIAQGFGDESSTCGRDPDRGRPGPLAVGGETIVVRLRAEVAVARVQRDAVTLV